MKKLILILAVVIAVLTACVPAPTNETYSLAVATLASPTHDTYSNTLAALTVHEHFTAHETYPLMTVVVQSDAETVTAVDYNGNLWEFGYFTEDDYMTGDVVILTMDDNGTPIIYDDIVIAAKYSGGWTEWNYRLSTGEGA